MFLEDKNGIYRLSAVVAVTPQLTHLHADPLTGKAYAYAKPDRIVAVLHFAGTSVVTDTDYEDMRLHFQALPDAVPGTQVEVFP